MTELTLISALLNLGLALWVWSQHRRIRWLRKIIDHQRGRL